MKTNQKGFSVVEVLLIVLVVGLLGAVGWLVYDRQQNQNEKATQPAATQAPTTSSTEQATEAKEDSYAGWKSYENGAISFKYPAEWKVAEVAVASGGNASTAESAVNVSFNTSEKYAEAATLEVYPASVSAVMKVQDNYYGQSTSAKVTKKQSDLNGRQATTYTIENMGITTTHVFVGAGGKTYSFKTVNESTNEERSKTYQDDVVKMINSLTIQ